MSFFYELKRRNVARVAVLYAIAGWVILQVADVLFEALNLPASSVRLVIGMLILGFPLVVVFSWVYEVTPEGLKREKDIDRSESIANQTANKLDVVIIILLVLAIGGLIVDRLIPERADSTTTNSAAAPASISSKSVAVMPFVNMSDDKSNEYFSDGLSEELLNLLSKVPDLRVAARTSSFSFKGERVDIATIAEKLNVAHVLEGSVRKSGDQVRITAQLIKADDGFHLWSQSFDRKLDNIFAIQDEIAAAVVDAMKIEILGKQLTTTAIDPQAYDLYLRARHFRTKDTTKDRATAIEYLKQSLAIEPDFAPSWVETMFVRFNQGNFGDITHELAEREARNAARRALEVDDQLASAHVAQSWVYMLYDFDWAEAFNSARRAVELEPDNNLALDGMGYVLLVAGRLEDALDVFEHAYSLDPLSLSSHRYRATTLISLGRFDDAEAAARESIEMVPDYDRSLFNLGMALTYGGKPAEGVEAFGRVGTPILRLYGSALALDKLGRSAEADDVIDKLLKDHEATAAFQLASIYALRGEHDDAFEWLNKAWEYRDPGITHTRASIPLRKLQSDPRWQDFLDKTRLSDKHLASVEF